MRLKYYIWNEGERWEAEKSKCRCGRNIKKDFK